MLSLCKSSTYSHRIWESYQKNTIFNKSQKITIQQKILSKHILQIFFLKQQCHQSSWLVGVSFPLSANSAAAPGPREPCSPKHGFGDLGGGVWKPEERWFTEEIVGWCRWAVFLFAWFTPWKISHRKIPITHLERKMIWTKPPWGNVPCWSSGVYVWCTFFFFFSDMFFFIWLKTAETPQKYRDSKL